MDVNKFEKVFPNKPGTARIGAISNAKYDPNTIFPQLETTKPQKNVQTCFPEMTYKPSFYALISDLQKLSKTLLANFDLWEHFSNLFIYLHKVKCYKLSCAVNDFCGHSPVFTVFEFSSITRNFVIGNFVVGNFVVGDYVL